MKNIIFASLAVSCGIGCAHQPRVAPLLPVKSRPGLNREKILVEVAPSNLFGQHYAGLRAVVISFQPQERVWTYSGGNYGRTPVCPGERSVPFFFQPRPEYVSPDLRNLKTGRRAKMYFFPSTTRQVEVIFICPDM